MDAAVACQCWRGHPTTVVKVAIRLILMTAVTRPSHHLSPAGRPGATCPNCRAAVPTRNRAAALAAHPAAAAAAV
jgi:hypothetical protein